jgi:branched-chain amino acid transport system substrate-binding protein
MLPAGAMAQEPIKIGILVALEGAFAAGGADGVRNVELAIQQAGGMAGGGRSRRSSRPPTPRPTPRSARPAS